MLAGLIAGLIAGCGTSAPRTALPAPAANEPVVTQCPAWLNAQQRGEGRLYQVDAQASAVRIHVFRGGRLSSLGHNHVLGAERLAGQAFVPQQGLQDAGVELSLRLEDLAIDKPEWRAGLGPEFASQPSESDIAGTRTNMMRALDGARYPALVMQSRSVKGAWPVLALRLAVQWHGHTREMDLPLRAAQPAGDGPLRAQGRLVLRQSDFGITPFAVLNGLIAIQDELVAEVDITARPAATCAALSPAG
ncbi:MAG: YceI family protein [Burkholderiaceae bacterium]